MTYSRRLSDRVPAGSIVFAIGLKAAFLLRGRMFIYHFPSIMEWRLRVDVMAANLFPLVAFSPYPLPPFFFRLGDDGLPNYKRAGPWFFTLYHYCLPAPKSRVGLPAHIVASCYPRPARHQPMWKYNSFFENSSHPKG